MSTNTAVRSIDTGVLLDEILSSPTYAGIDTDALRRHYDISSAILDAVKSAPDAAAPEPLTTQSFSTIPANGWIIESPGSYSMSSDCSWNPAAAGAAITIKATDVVLDLGGHTLTVIQPSGSEALAFNGIHIESSANVTLQNGTISGASLCGVQASLSAQVGLSKVSVTDLSYTNTTAKFATPSGILMSMCAGIRIDGCTVSGIEVDSAACAGIQLFACWLGSVSDCSVSKLHNADGSAQGFSYLLCQGIKTSHASCSDFKTDNKGVIPTMGHTSIGFIPTFCKALEFDDCSSSDITGCCDDAHGMSLFLVREVSVNNFAATGVTDGPAPYYTGAKATGLEVYGDQITISNSRASTIHATVPQDLQAAGFSLWGDTITLSNCSAADVQVFDKDGKPDTALGYGTGYGWAPDPRKAFNHTVASHVQYIDCSTSNSQLGCDTWNHTDSVWTGFKADSCGQCCLNLPKGATRTLTMNRCSESPTGKFESVKITNQAANNTVPSCCQAESEA